MPARHPYRASGLVQAPLWNSMDPRSAAEMAARIWRFCDLLRFAGGLEASVPPYAQAPSIT